MWALNSGPGNAVARSEKVARDTDGAFRPSETQWASLKLAAVRQVAFRDERATDGKIAINEDTTTPVFSPYSGRVSRLIAKPGDHVEVGKPLFAIDASEYVQGQNDLVTAVAGVEKAKSRLELAKTSEKRQRELLSIRGGALKDLAAGRNPILCTRRATCARPRSRWQPSRNRLRILGRTDEEIDHLEKVDRIGAEVVVAAPIAGTVIQRKVGLGQYINAGATDPVFTVGNLRHDLADRQRARVRRAQDEGGRAGRGHGARLPRPRVQRQAFLRGSRTRSDHASLAGARRGRQPRP